MHYGMCEKYDIRLTVEIPIENPLIFITIGFPMIVFLVHAIRAHAHIKLVRRLTRQYRPARAHDKFTERKRYEIY